MAFKNGDNPAAIANNLVEKSSTRHFFFVHSRVQHTNHNEDIPFTE